MRRLFLGWFLALVLSAGAGMGQAPQADKIRQQVGKIGLLGNITVDVKDGLESYGSVSRIGADDFSINEIDQRREITLRYSEVKRVRADYGTTRNIRGRRIQPRTRRIVMPAVVGGTADAGVCRGGIG